jgi:hypothetical protein
MSKEDKEDHIGKALGLAPLEHESTINNMIAKAHDDSAKSDFESARANIHEVINKNQEAIEKLLQIADQSQHPRAFEVLAKLMDTQIVASKELLEIQTKIRQIDAIDSPTNSKAKTINNNLFVGSTAELQKLLKDMKNE